MADGIDTGRRNHYAPKVFKTKKKRKLRNIKEKIENVGSARKRRRPQGLTIVWQEKAREIRR